MFRWKDKKIDSSLDRAKAFRNTAAYATLFAALGAMVFFGVCDPGSRQGPQRGTPEGAAARVNGDEVTSQEFRRAYQNAYTRYQRVYAEAFDPAQLQLAHSVLNSLVEERVVYAEAKRLGLLASDDEVDKQILDIFKDEKSGLFDSKRFQDVLRSNGFNEASFQDQMRRGITVNRYRQLVGQTAFVSSDAAKLDYEINETKIDVDYLKFDREKAEVAVSDDDVKKFLDEAGKTKVKEYYEKNPTEFNQEKKVKARHILTSYKGATRASGVGLTRSKDEAKRHALHVLTKVKGDGADFIAIANKETDETSGKTKGGDLGYFAAGDLAKEFSAAAFKLKPGEISEVVESPFGFHIIKVEAVQEAVTKSLADATNGIARELVEREKRPKVIAEQSKEILAALQSGGSASNLLEKYKVSWQSTGPFAIGARSMPKIGGGPELREAALSLKKPGQIYGKVVDEGGSSYILKLKSYVGPDLTKLNDEKREDLAKNAAYSQSQTLFNLLKDKAQKKLQDGGDIWLNEGYLALDEARKKDVP